MTVAVHFAVIPNFTSLSFSDDANIGEVLLHVLRGRNRIDPKNPDKALIKDLASKIHVQTVGELRQFTDHDWVNLDLPAMCTVYLKHAIRQSSRKAAGSKTFMEKLADDFNYGQPFDMSLYQSHLKRLADMGFKTEDALEALLITDNKGIEGALEILFQNDPNVRKSRREEACQRLGRQKPSVDEPLMGNMQAQGGDDVVSSRQLAEEKRRRAHAERELREERKTARVERYKVFLQGLCASESIGLLQFQTLQTYQQDNNITEKDHHRCLEELNMTLEQFNALRSFEKGEKRDRECVVCLDKPKDHVVTPCMHMCLCEDCAKDFSNPKAKCPICSKPVKKVKRIFE